MTERVAVIMTCYNEGLYIGAAVRSVLDQTRADMIDVVVIADDGSNDETLQVLKEIEAWDPRVQVLYGPGGAGLSAQRNAAIARTTSPVLAILDGDDLWTPDKLERQLPALADPDVGLVYGDYFVFANLDIGTARRAGVLDLGKADDLVRAYFLNDPPIIPSTTLIRRSAFDACGQFDPAVRVFEDTDFFLRMAKVCRFALVDVPSLYKRGHTTSITGGRKDLMAHHAYVAFKAAVTTPDLLPIVPRRLAERARKLGNYRFLMGDAAEATRLLLLATRLDVWNVKGWASLTVAALFPGLTYRLFAAKLRARRVAIGVVEP
jgi:glycosyltransferase involved in cell wall biosynthesis